MELVYLWVEDYKNIHKQGFNFSPRFECKFHYEYEKYIDEEGKEQERLKDNCKLEIIEKKEDEYIKDFFGDNINVTAIVGKNGSGKSSVIESFLEIIIGIENKNIIETERKYILLYDNKYISNIGHETEIDFFTISLDYALDTFTNDIYRSEAHYRYEYNKKYILEPNKFSQNKANINLDIDAEKMRKRIITYQSKLKNDLLNNDIFVPEKVIIRFDSRRIFYKDNNNNKKNNKKGSNFNKITKANYIEEIKALNKVFLANHEYISAEEKNKAYNVENFLTELKKIYTFNGDEFKMGATENIRIQKGIELKFGKLSNDFKELMGSLPRYFLLDFVSDNDLNYTDLSTGEKHLQKLIYTIIDYTFQSKNKNILVLIDEIELYLHPQWQKNYIKILIESLKIFLEKNDVNIHFLLTTHSAFVVSDLLKQNIIFLDKDEDGTCKVVNGLKDKKQTFGANIHTLLSDSFFMEDGLMGEFAKGKIEEVIDYLNNKKSPIKDNDEAQKLINIIGEPIIKNQLQKMLDSKRLSKIDEIDSIRTEINDLEKRLKEIEDANDKS